MYYIFLSNMFTHYLTCHTMQIVRQLGNLFRKATLFRNKKSGSTDIKSILPLNIIENQNGTLQLITDAKLNGILPKSKIEFFNFDFRKLFQNHYVFDKSRFFFML
jgi:hypothetical protein